MPGDETRDRAPLQGVEESNGWACVRVTVQRDVD
jgi:hypothetical protein